MKKVNLKNMRIKFAKVTKIKKGMSLLEIIIVLGIIGTIAAGVVVLAQRALDNKAIADLNSNINSVRMATLEAFRTSGYGQGDTSKLLTAAELRDPVKVTAAVPTDMRAQLITIGALSADELISPIDQTPLFIQNVEKVTAIASATKGVMFSLSVPGLSVKQCASILVDQGASWDFAEVVSYTPGTPAVMATVPNTPVAISAETGVFSGKLVRSLDAKTGSTIVSPLVAATACETASGGTGTPVALVFASR